MGKRNARLAGLLVACWAVANAAAADTERGVGSSPAPRPDRAAPAFTGSASCRECHEQFYRLWAPSHHGRAMQPYTAEFARTNLTPQHDELVIEPYRYRAEIEGGQGWVVERGPAGEKKLPIEHVLGGKNVYYFLTPSDRGRLQTLPVAYDVRRREWFDTSASGMRHFPGGAEHGPIHWTDRAYTFNTSCYSCHVSQLSTNYDLASDSYHTVWAEPGINCETCHDAAGEHVRVCREAGEGQVPQDLKIIITRNFNAQQTNAMCAPCHAQMVPLTTTFKPGDRYFDHFDLVTLEDPDFYPDGRDLGENYTHTTWLMSPCVQSGKLDCIHCHTSSGRFRFSDDPNRACAPCHQQRVDNVAEHSHHRADSAGNQCIGCHMPKTEFARMVRSDHSMLPPTPAATVAFKSPNACNLCHADQTAAWADRYVRQWRSRDYQAPVLYRAGLIEAARKRQWSRLPDMLTYLSSADRDEIFATALIRLLGSCEAGEKWPAVVRALKDPSPLVRASAAEALDGYLTPEAVAALLAATRDEFRLVRVRAAAALAAVSSDTLNPRDREGLARATAEFEAAMRARPDDHASHYNLGNFYAERRELDRAIACYQTATALEPNDIAPLVNASLAYNAAGQNAQAEASLRRALAIEPASLAANVNLGMLLGEMGRTREAEAAFRAALKADPQSAVAAYNLGVILGADRVAEAVEWCRTASQLRPDEPKYAYTLAYYLHRSGDADGAIQVLDPLVNEGRANAEIYALLGSIYEERGAKKEAIAVYRRAVANERLTQRERFGFAARIQALSTP